MPEPRPVDSGKVAWSPPTSSPFHIRKARRRSSLYYAQSANDDPEPMDATVDEPSTPTRKSHSSPVKPLNVCSSCRQQMLHESPAAVASPDSGHGFPDSPFRNSPRDRRKSSHRESLVGSYEESLFSRRLAASSCSAPVSFSVSIGAIGTGKYAGQLPSHLHTEFPAYFYDWELDPTRESSPYVGDIDLDQVYADKSSKFPGYRIPRTGQLQIVVSNYEKTAVHFFLVPYDLYGLPPLSKTFIRQKTFEGDKKKTLLKAVHLQFVRPAKGGIYLYGSIRLVFHNRTSSQTTTRSAGALVSSAHLSTDTVNGGYATWTPEPPPSCGLCSTTIA